MCRCIYYKHNSSPIQLFPLSHCSICLVVSIIKDVSIIKIIQVNFSGFLCRIVHKLGCRGGVGVGGQAVQAS